MTSAVCRGRKAVNQIKVSGLYMKLKNRGRRSENIFYFADKRFNIGMIGKQYGQIGKSLGIWKLLKMGCRDRGSVFGIRHKLVC